MSGETNRTWQDSCEGLVRWPAFRPLPGERLYFGQEGRTATGEKLLSRFKEATVSASVDSLQPCVCSVSNFYWKWMSACFFYLSVLFHPQSSDLGRCFFFFFLVNTKSSTPVARAFSCLPTLTNAALTDTLSGKQKKKEKKKRLLQLWSKQLCHYQGACFSWMEAQWHTATGTFQTVEIPGGAASFG